MTKKLLLLILALSLGLSGCTWMDGSYVRVTPHQEQTPDTRFDTVSASGYGELRKVLEEMVLNSTTEGIIYVTDYDEEAVTNGMQVIARYITERFPVGAYAVEKLDYEVGTSSGKPAIAVNIHYRHSPLEIQRIRRLGDMSQVQGAIATSLERIDSVLVMLIENYEAQDFTQMVQDYARDHPDTVMETPQVTEAHYGSGDARVVELKYTYLTSRDALRQMRDQVKPVFEAAELYVSADATDYQKYSQLYSFLMERFDYRIQTSITPSYSLLHHGVGDSRAFAVTFAAMCRQVGLECITVTGTRDGEAWTWNIVRDGTGYYHVDLLKCSAAGGYHQRGDGEMTGYVWDYSAYPQCRGGSPARDPSPEKADPAEPES